MKKNNQAYYFLFFFNSAAVLRNFVGQIGWGKIHLGQPYQKMQSLKSI